MDDRQFRFILMDKMLKKEGWLPFDDLQWTYASKLKEGKHKTDGINLRSMGQDELEQPHIELIDQLLVMQHPDYTNFRVKDNWWGWAQKTDQGSRRPVIEMSKNYKRQLTEWENRSGRRHRALLEPFPS